MVAIVVQPPLQVPTNTILYPPVVAHMPHSDTSYVFGMAVLLDYTGGVLEGQIGSASTSMAVQVADPVASPRGGSSSSSSGGSSLYFTFTDLSVSQPGTYSIRVDVLFVDYEDTRGARLIASCESRAFAVRDEDLPLEPLSKHAHILPPPTSPARLD